MKKTRTRNRAESSPHNKNFITFISYFLVFFILATGGFVVAGKAIKEVGESPIFGETETNLMDDMPVLVSKDSIFFEAFKDKNRINVLLMGFNQNLADTIMVVSFDYDVKHVDLISIPRDTYYYREEYKHSPGFLKINAVYQKTKEPLETAIAVSEILLGMPLHFYAIVDYDGIKEIVDTMGGVPMHIPFHMKYTDITDKPPLYINIPAGDQVLDGEHAVQFLRYRKGYREGDLGRVKAQQEFMKSAFKQMLGFDLPKIARVILKNVESDIDLGTAMKIVTKAIGIKPDDITTYVMPHTLQDEAPYYVYPDSKGIAEVITEIYSIEVEPESGTETEGESETDSGSSN
ncbi:MAG: LCP family protein [Clostridiales Family XIII bacterium]|jgi:LCP family protein required for cell wall assembly|nr:LCP family protein [Clostridiales Family XIII bacterium]